MDLAAFAAMARVAEEEIERCRDAGLLDPDGDGRFDDEDVLRLQIVGTYLEKGSTFERIAEEVRGSTNFLIRGLFAPGRAYTLDEAAERTGIEPERLKELAVSVGLGSTSWYDDDLRAIKGVGMLIEAGIPWSGVLEGARVYGDVLRRLAEAEARMTHRYLCDRLAESGVDEPGSGIAMLAAIDVLVPTAEELIRHMHADQLLRATVRHVLEHQAMAPGTRLGESFEATILFADLALFTSLTQLHGDEAAAEVLDAFDGKVRSLAGEHDGTVVKQIGDAFMLTFVEPAAAVRFALALRDAARSDELPGIRVGIHTGPVLYRVGDYVGATVNLASRVTAMALPDTILVTEPVARSAEEAGISADALGVRHPRGSDEPIAIYRVKRKSDQAPREAAAG